MIKGPISSRFLGYGERLGRHRMRVTYIQFLAPIRAHERW